MNVYKGKQAISIYGEKGENGVIAINTKDALYPNLNNLKVPDLKSEGPEETKSSTEKSPWKVSAGVPPKNKDEMSASELLDYYQKQTTENFQQDLEGALIIVDGKEMAKKDFDKILADEIESMSVLKGEAAKKKYGKKGKNGVLEVKLKKKGVTIRGTDPNPLIIIDGKESSKTDLENLDQDKIQSINVLKDEQAFKKYGKKGTDGVVEIITKKE